MSNIPIKILEDTGEEFFPKSHENAIVDDNGTTLATKLGMLTNPVFTLSDTPTALTLTHLENNVVYTFKIGDQVRVHDTESGTSASNYYKFYTLKDISNNTAYWEESGVDGANTKNPLINSKQSKISINTTAGTSGSIALDCDTVYELGTLTGNVTFSLNAAPNDGYLHEYIVSFDTGFTAYTIAMPIGISFPSTISIVANKHYEINIKGSYGLLATW